MISIGNQKISCFFPVPFIFMGRFRGCRNIIMTLNALSIILNAFPSAVFCLDYNNFLKWLLFWTARFHNRTLSVLPK